MNVESRTWTLRESIRASFRLYARNVVPLTTISAVALVPWLVASAFLLGDVFSHEQLLAWASRAPSLSMALPALLKLMLVINGYTVAILLADAALISAARAAYSGESISVAGTFRRALPFMGRLLGATTVVQLIAMAWIFVGAVPAGLIAGLLIYLSAATGGEGPSALVAGLVIIATVGGCLPGIVYLLRRVFLCHVVVLEGASAMGSLPRANELMAGNFLRTFGLLMNMALLVAVSQHVLNLCLTPTLALAGAAGPALAWAVGMVPTVVFMPLSTVALTMAYLQARQKEEARGALSGKVAGALPGGGDPSPNLRLVA